MIPTSSYHHVDFLHAAPDTSGQTRSAQRARGSATTTSPSTTFDGAISVRRCCIFAELALIFDFCHYCRCRCYSCSGRCHAASTLSFQPPLPLLKSCRFSSFSAIAATADIAPRFSMPHFLRFTPSSRFSGFAIFAADFSALLIGRFSFISPPHFSLAFAFRRHTHFLSIFRQPYAVSCRFFHFVSFTLIFILMPADEAAISPAACSSFRRCRRLPRRRHRCRLRSAARRLFTPARAMIPIRLALCFFSRFDLCFRSFLDFLRLATDADTPHVFAISIQADFR